ncbi:helix-turn-helix transcriptional regulator [Sphingomonas sp. RS2018]
MYGEIGAFDYIWRGSVPASLQGLVDPARHDSPMSELGAEVPAMISHNVAIAAPSATLVSLSEFRSRSVESLPDSADDTYEPMAGMIRELGRALTADGVLVTWHADDAPPAFLFASGACEPHSDVEREMIAAACDVAADGRADPVHWMAAGTGAEGSVAVLTTRMAAGEGVVTLTTFFRRLGGTARTGARDVAARMLPMVQGFFRIWSSRARALAANQGLAAALNSSAVATLIVDSTGRLIFANTVAEHLLASNDGLRRAGAMLSGTRLADTIRLHASIEHVIHAADAGSTPCPVLALNRRSGRPLLAAVLPAPTAGGASGNAAAVVHVFDPDHDLEPLLTPVCRLYGLSPVETRLASLLARGMALGDAAKAMHVQEQTARSYLKSVFLKTDTNRQAQLVWLMLKSAVLTAPGCPTRLM